MRKKNFMIFPMEIRPEASLAENAGKTSKDAASFLDASHPLAAADPSATACGKASSVMAYCRKGKERSTTPARVFLREIVLTPSGNPIIFDPDATD